MKNAVKHIINFLHSLSIYLLILPLLGILAFLSRFLTRTKIGIGPEPLINNVYHKKALECQGYEVETFVYREYFITNEFDIRFDCYWKPIRPVLCYCHVIFNYSCIYIYFTGGPLGHSKLKKLEPWLLSIARVKTVLMPYGADVQDVLRSNNLIYRHSLFQDYPKFQKKQRKLIINRIERWIKNGTYIISGCDWVFYLPHWDELMLGHFSIDLAKFHDSSKDDFPGSFSSSRPLRLLHAPNHRTIKGSRFFLEAVEELKQEGKYIQLDIIEKMPNSVVLEKISEADLILDQLVIGWYAMFALEALASGKPVVCYLDPELIKLYEYAGLLIPEELPIINADFRSIKRVIREIYEGIIDVSVYKRKTRTFVQNHHSIEYVGGVFAKINEKLGLKKQPC